MKPLQFKYRTFNTAESSAILTEHVIMTFSWETKRQFLLWQLRWWNTEDIRLQATDIQKLVCKIFSSVHQLTGIKIVIRNTGLFIYVIICPFILHCDTIINTRFKGKSGRFWSSNKLCWSWQVIGICGILMFKYNIPIIVFFSSHFNQACS